MRLVKITRHHTYLRARILEKIYVMTLLVSRVLVGVVRMLL